MILEGMVVAGLMVGDIVDILIPSYFVEIVELKRVESF